MRPRESGRSIFLTTLTISKNMDLKTCNPDCSGTGHEGRASRERDVSLVSPSLFPPFSLLPQPTPLTRTSPPSPPCSIRCPPPPPPLPLPPCRTPQFQHQATRSSCRHCPLSTRPSCPAASTAPHSPPPSSRDRKQVGSRPHRSCISPTDFHHFHILSSTRDRRNLTPTGWLFEPNSTLSVSICYNLSNLFNYKSSA